MEKMFTAGPMQNIDWHDHGVERCIPHLISDTLNGIENNKLNVQMWNNNTPKTATQYKGSGTKKSFENYCDDEISIKNNIMTDVGYNMDDKQVDVVADTDAQFGMWVNDKIDRLMSSGTIYEERGEFHICMDCGNVIAESSVEIAANCVICNSSRVEIKNEKGLFVDFPEDKDSLFQDQLFSSLTPSAQKDMSNRFKLTPHRSFINKRRFTGILLEKSGFDGFVVDPKVAIALMPEFVANKHGIDSIVQIHGASTATNTLPYTSIFNDGSFHNSYIFINKTPAGVLLENQNLGAGFYGYCAANLISKMSPMKIYEFSAIKHEFIKTKNGLQNALQWLENDNANSVIELQGDTINTISNINELFNAVELTKL